MIRRIAPLIAVTAIVFLALGLWLGGHPGDLPGGVRVARVFAGSPAQRGGIRSGDEILAVNGQSLAGVPVDVATSRITGPPGTHVTLAVAPRGTARAHEITLQRARINVPVASSRM